MLMSFTLQLPRDALSVPVMRGVLTASLNSVRVNRDCVNDIAIAITEACTNVLEHSADDDEYEVTARIHDDVCEIAVIDTGHGFDADSLGRGNADISAESGRGIQLMRALVDRVAFVSRPEAGTIVHLEKRLLLEADSPLRALGAGDGTSNGRLDVSDEEQQRLLAERDAMLAQVEAEG